MIFELLVNILLFLILPQIIQTEDQGTYTPKLTHNVDLPSKSRPVLHWSVYTYSKPFIYTVT